MLILTTYHSSMNTLSIQIPTIHERRDKFSALFSYVEDQARGLPVEVIFDISGRGMPFIGKKRDDMYRKADALFSVQIDDDDWLPKNYVASILSLIDENPDAKNIGYQIKTHIDGKEGRALVSCRVQGWSNVTGRVHPALGRYNFYQYPYHKVPIRTSICQAIGVENIPYGEDYKFSQSLEKSGLLSPDYEVLLKKDMYIYRTKGKHVGWYRGE